MGFVEFVIICAAVVVVAGLVTYALTVWFPGNATVALVCKVIWGVAILIIVVTLLNATGLMKYDPKIPQVR